jgi:hypothetical protein
MIRIPCFCRERQLTTEEATYVVNGVPCHDRDCYDDCLKAEGVAIHQIVTITSRRPELVT